MGDEEFWSITAKIREGLTVWDACGCSEAKRQAYTRAKRAKRKRIPKKLKIFDDEIFPEKKLTKQKNAKKSDNNEDILEDISDELLRGVQVEIASNPGPAIFRIALDILKARSKAYSSEGGKQFSPADYAELINKERKDDEKEKSNKITTYEEKNGTSV